jgi:hypothetical protein
MQALNEAVKKVYDRQGVGERARLELSDGTGLWWMVCTQGMRVVSTVLQASLTFPLTSPEEEGDPEAMHPHLPPPGGDSHEEEDSGDDTVMIDLGDGIILTSKRVPVPAGFCDDEREEAAEGKEEEPDAGGGARSSHPSSLRRHSRTLLL